MWKQKVEKERCNDAVMDGQTDKVNKKQMSFEA